MVESERSESQVILYDAIEIIYRLKKLGYTQTKLAAELSVSSGVVGNVIRGDATSFHIASRIAELLDVDINMLWPKNYIFKPRPQRRRAHHKEAKE